jgi:hypothetical protein
LTTDSGAFRHGDGPASLADGVDDDLDEDPKLGRAASTVLMSRARAGKRFLALIQEGRVWDAVSRLAKVSGMGCFLRSAEGSANQCWVRQSLLEARFDRECPRSVECVGCSLRTAGWRV